MDLKNDSVTDKRVETIVTMKKMYSLVIEDCNCDR